MHRLLARRIGFRPETVTVNVAAGTISELRVRLRPNAQWVAPVVIDARTSSYSGLLRGFYERRERSQGVFFTAEDIEERNPRYVSDLLRMIPGTRIMPGSGQSVVTFRDRNCLPLVWIDGTAATTAYLDPDVFDPHTLAGIEVYKGAATVPGALMGTRGKGSCGVIALWTKRVEKRPKATAKKPVTAEDLANLIASLRLHTVDQVDVPAATDSAHPVAPVFPDALLSAGIPGRVVVEFVVDTTGHADMSTFGTVSTTHPLFTEAVRRAVESARFTPAMLGGRRVLQLMQLPFSFTVLKP
jgi:TonB family protein